MSLAAATVPVSTVNIDIVSEPDIIRTLMACVSGKLRDNQDLAIIPEFVIMDILSQTIIACVGDMLIFGMVTVLALAQDKTILHE